MIRMDYFFFPPLPLFLLPKSTITSSVGFLYQIFLAIFSSISSASCLTSIEVFFNVGKELCSNSSKFVLIIQCFLPLRDLSSNIFNNSDFFASIY